MKLQVYRTKKNMQFGLHGNPVPEVFCIYPEKPKQEYIETCGSKLVKRPDGMHRTKGAVFPLVTRESIF